MAGPFIASNFELYRQKFNDKVKNIEEATQVMRNYVTVDDSNSQIETFYQESTAELTAQSGIGKHSQWYADNVVWDTLNASPVQYGLEARISWRDQQVQALQLPTRTTIRIANRLRRLDDLNIYNTLSQNQSATTISTLATSAAWDNATRANRIPHEDIAEAISVVQNSQLQAYVPNTIFLNPKQYCFLRSNDYVLASWDSSSPQLMSKGQMGNIFGLDAVVNPVVVSDSCVIANASQAVTVKDVAGFQTNVEDKPGKYTIYSGWFFTGYALTDPKASLLLTNTDA